MMRDFVRRIALPVLLDISQITVWSLTRLGQVADSRHEQHEPGEVLRIPPVKDAPPDTVDPRGPKGK